MKKSILSLVILIAFGSVHAQTFTLKSADLSGQATDKQVFNSFGCTGQNSSPQLSWENAPEETKSFAVTIYDEDAPTGSGWWHWLIFDLSASTSELKTGAGNPALKLAPAGAVQSMTDFGTTGYGGPCPPEGSKPHRYVVTVYALDTDKLGLDATTNPALVGFMLEQHLLQKASLIFYYNR